MVVSAVVWPGETSAPLVTLDMPTRPEIGAVIVAQPRLTLAASTAARCWAMAAVA
jgi:hypothetical protein